MLAAQVEERIDPGIKIRGAPETVAGSTRGRDIFAAMVHQRNRRAALALQQTEIAEQCRNLAGGVFVDGMQADQGVEDEKNGAVKQESGLKPLLVGDAVQAQRIRGDDAKVQASQRKAVVLRERFQAQP